MRAGMHMCMWFPVCAAAALCLPHATHTLVSVAQGRARSHSSPCTNDKTKHTIRYLCNCARRSYLLCVICFDDSEFDLFLSFATASTAPACWRRRLPLLILLSCCCCCSSFFRRFFHFHSFYDWFRFLFISFSSHEYLAMCVCVCVGRTTAHECE